MKTQTSEPVLRAVTDTVAALRLQQKQVAEIEEALHSARQRRSDLLAALSALARTLSPKEKAQIQLVIDGIFPAPREVGTDADTPMQAIINLMIARDKDTVRVEEVQSFLDEKGYNVSSKYASNTLRKLADEGQLVRLGRGLYRYSNLNIHAVGVTNKDYDE